LRTFLAVERIVQHRVDVVEDRFLGDRRRLACFLLALLLLVILLLVILLLVILLLVIFLLVIPAQAGIQFLLYDRRRRTGSQPSLG
jgi:Flp pilus assembly protein TadB